VSGVTEQSEAASPVVSSSFKLGVEIWSLLVAMIRTMDFIGFIDSMV